MSEDVSVNEAEQKREGQEVQRSPQVPAGAQLAMHRESRGWTIEQVASQLNLASRQIQALEADNYAALPGMVIVRGFIRSYAKLLRVDPVPILSAIASEKAEPEAVLQDRGSLSATFSEARVPSTKAGMSSGLLIAGLILAIVVALGFAAQRMGWIPLKTSASSASAATKHELPVSVEVPPAHQEMPTTQEAPETSAVSHSKPVAETATVSVEEKSAQPAPTPAVETVTENAATPAPAVPLDSKNALVFKLKEDSWVEIRRADDSILVSRLFKAGTTEAFAITSPVSMVIGNAAGVTVTLRGKPLDVSGNSSNVARLDVK